jgi:hypothetical protein
VAVAIKKTIFPANLLFELECNVENVKDVRDATVLPWFFVLGERFFIGS